MADVSAEGNPTKQPRPTSSDATRERILVAGMQVFSQEGYSGATTRKISALAGVTLPVIAYHFGNKEGLYLACAEAILDMYRLHMVPLVDDAREAASSGRMTRTEARVWIDQILVALVSAVGADPEDRIATDFVLRELSQQGPGHAYLYQELWKPGIRLMADLVAIARDRPRADPTDKAGALMLLAAITAFTSQASISLPLMQWDGIGRGQQALLVQQLTMMVDGLVAASETS